MYDIVIVIKAMAVVTAEEGGIGDIAIVVVVG
jgi:hypothetical protein